MGFNVPLCDDCKITDTTRISSTIPTINALLAMSPDRIVITSHLGRPKGQKKDKLSLAPVAAALESLLNKKVILIKDWFRDDLESEILSKQEKGAIILLENVRFYIEEEGKGEDKDKNKLKAKEEEIKRFRAILSGIADLFVCDAFGTCHRGHSSMVGCEAKVSDKIKVIESLLDRVNQMIIAGGMCFTFLKVNNKMNIGTSLYDEEGAKLVTTIMEKAKAKNVDIILPTDFVCGDKFANDAKIEKCTLEKGILDGFMGLDIGEESRKTVCETILKAKTVVFNGPPGVFEMENFSVGTKALVEALAQATEKGVVTIVGGGDSASACNKYGCGDKVSHVSTGGGASLELLEGKILPGVAFLSDKSDFEK